MPEIRQQFKCWKVWVIYEMVETFQSETPPKSENARSSLLVQAGARNTDRCCIDREGKNARRGRQTHDTRRAP